MPKFVLDGVEYNSEDLDEEGMALLNSLKFSEEKIRALKNEINVYQTANNTYLRSLKVEIDKHNQKSD